MNTIDAGAVQLMQEMQRLSSAARSSESLGVSSGGLGLLGTASSPNQSASGTSFAELLKASLDQVNAAQNTADSMQMQYETGTGNVDLSDVMIAMQKAGLSLQMVQNVRGRLVSAYQDLLNTPL